MVRTATLLERFDPLAALASLVRRSIPIPQNRLDDAGINSLNRFVEDCLNLLVAFPFVLDRSQRANDGLHQLQPLGAPALKLASILRSIRKVNLTEDQAVAAALDLKGVPEEESGEAGEKWFEFQNTVEAAVEAASTVQELILLDTHPTSDEEESDAPSSVIFLPPNQEMLHMQLGDREGPEPAEQPQGPLTPNDANRGTPPPLQRTKEIREVQKRKARALQSLNRKRRASKKVLQFDSDSEDEAAAEKKAKKVINIFFNF